MEIQDEDIMENEDIIGNWGTDKGDAQYTPRHKLHRGFNLELITSRGDSLSERPTIPATTSQILCYLRSYISSACKVEILCMQNADFNVFIWSYVLNVFFKSLPCSYLYIFLGSYAPEHHLFLSKMIPFFYGFNWLFIMAGFLDLLVVNDLCSILMQYIAQGISSNNPWAKCPEVYTNYSFFNGTIVTLQCLEMQSFVDLVKGEEPQLVKPIGYLKNDKSFQLAQIVYFQKLWMKHASGSFGLDRMYCITIWFLVIFFNRKLYNTNLWTAQHVTQWIMNGVFVGILLDLYYETELTNKEQKLFSTNDPIELALKETCVLNSISMLSESLSAPPLLHLLSARRNQDIKPTRDSAIVTANNALYYIFRGILRNRLRVYCNSLIGVPIYASANNQLTLFYMLPIYFSNFELGHIWVVVTFIVILANEFFTWIITFQCLLEVLLWEWKWMKRVPVTMFLCFLGSVTNIFADEYYKLFIYVLSKMLPALCEILVVYFMYPFGRLLDDINFHFGIQPSTFETMVLRAMPIFYAWKCYRVMNTLHVVFVDQGHITDTRILVYITWTVILVPSVCGAFYAIYNEVYKKKRACSQLFVPVPEFGPRNFVTRQLRKIYDSRDYIDSTAPRVLSRHLMQKSESRVYKIGIRYDSPICWRPLQPHYNFKQSDQYLETRQKSKSNMDLRDKDF